MEQLSVNIGARLLLIEERSAGGISVGLTKAIYSVLVGPNACGWMKTVETDVGARVT
jgi:hypothetical protein